MILYRECGSTYVASVPVGRYASVGDAHAEAADAAELILRGQVEGVRLTLVASQARRVLLQTRAFKALAVTVTGKV